MIGVGTILRGRYRLDRSLGAGAFGQVFRAHDLRLDRAVAIKVLRHDLLGDNEAERVRWLRSFEQEARTIAALDHPHILAIFDSDQEEDSPYLVMALITGGSLNERLKKAGKFEAPQVATYLRQIADGLDYAHQRGIIHRDLKPDNIMVHGDGRLLIADFGIAKVVDEARVVSTTSRVIGTPLYMAPEQFEGKIGVRSDIYALGCILFQLLTGTVPYTGTNEYQIILAHIQGMIPQLVDRGCADLPPAIQAVIERALAKDPLARFASAGELAAALSVALAPPAAPHTSAGKRTKTAGTKPAAPAAPRANAGRRTKPSTAAEAPTVVDAGAADQTVLASGAEAPTVFATGGDAPTVVATTPDSSTLRVAPDGSGHFRTLAEAVDVATPGATILLARGIHRLDQNLQLPRAITIRGEGRDVTTILSEWHDPATTFTKAGVALLSFDGTGRFALHDLAVRRAVSGGAGANVVQVSSGEVDIARCDFSGGAAALKFIQRGTGLRLSGTVRGTVAQCRMRENEGAGIALSGAANVLLRENECRANGESGIIYSDTATGTAQGNRCAGNGDYGFLVEKEARVTVEGNALVENEQHGLIINDQAQARVERNESRANKWSGIVCAGTMVGDVRRNSCIGNGSDGLIIKGQARPTVEENTSRANKGAGITYTDTAAGTARRNICVENTRFGFHLQKASHPAIEGNEVRANSAGIACFNTAGGTVQGNLFAENTTQGFYAGDQARPTVVGNEFRANKKTGVAYFGDSAGLLRDNTVAGNEEHGIFIAGKAQPLVDGNRCLANKRIGLSVWEEAAPRLTQNVSRGNGEAGLLVSATAKPTIDKGNQWSGNTGPDVDDKRPKRWWQS